MFYALCLAHWQVTESETLKIWRTSSMKKNKLELTDKEYDALRALLYQTTTAAYAKAVGCAVFMAAHLELFPETYKTLKEINNKINL